jgi:hypothetical protein
VDELHQAAFKAAVRKWADTSSPRNLGSPLQHRRWRSLDTHAATRPGFGHRRARSSVDSPDISLDRSYIGCADPVDVSEVASLFKDYLNDFLVYQEYCANHSLIAHELQRHAPVLWSTYESGIESLAKSLVAIDHKRADDRKGLTVGDLLIKPIQRVTKYPLLFDDLLRHTPVADCPNAHAAVDSTLESLRGVVQVVNEAANNSEAQAQIQRRWSLQSRLNYQKVSLTAEGVRSLGNTQLCGVLHVTWQNKSRIDGGYALCVLFDWSLIIALPTGFNSRFDIIAFVHLRDLNVASASDGRGEFTTQWPFHSIDLLQDFNAIPRFIHGKPMSRSRAISMRSS